MQWRNPESEHGYEQTVFAKRVTPPPPPGDSEPRSLGLVWWRPFFREDDLVLKAETAFVGLHGEE